MTEEERIAHCKTLDAVDALDPAAARAWYRSAFFSHEDAVERLREKIADLRRELLLALTRPVCLTVKQARLLDVCRVCLQSTNGLRQSPGDSDALVLNYGEEFAHASCLEREKGEKAKGT